MKCPKCESENIKKSFEYEHQKVGWEDGLGSPGTITFKHDKYTCKQCNYSWRDAKGKLVG